MPQSLSLSKAGLNSGFLCLSCVSVAVSFAVSVLWGKKEREKEREKKRMKRDNSAFQTLCKLSASKPQSEQIFRVKLCQSVMGRSSPKEHRQLGSNHRRESQDKTKNKHVLDHLLLSAW